MPVIRARKWIRTTFGFSKTETNAFLIMIPAVIVVVMSLPLWRWYRHYYVHEDFSQESAYLDSLISRWEHTEKITAPATEVAQTPAFEFNPNTATPETLALLGFDKGVVRRIERYRQKGGVFKTKDDLGKIYGMDSSFFLGIKKYIQIPVEVKQNREAKPQKNNLTRFDMNTADTLAFIQIDGIGPVLARRVVRYRDKLGGFVTGEQLYEVYGLDSTVVRRVLMVAYVAESYEPAKIDINAASAAQLSAHPYISGQVAKAIVAYRFQHGFFSRIEDLRNVVVVTDELYSKISPYLSTGGSP